MSHSDSNIRFPAVRLLLLPLLFLPGAAADPECSPAITNSNCVITLDREAPSAPLPIRLAPRAHVTVRMTKRPLEKIQFEATYTDVAKPDPFVALFSSFVTPLKSLTLMGVVRSATPTLAERLDRIDAAQQAAQQDLEALKAGLDSAAQRLKQLQETKAGTWNVAGFGDVRDRIVCEIAASGNSKPTPVDTSFRCSSSTTGIGVRTPPAGAIKALDDAVAAAIKEFETVASPTPAVVTEFNTVVTNQGKLNDSLKAVQAAQATLLQAAAVLEKIDVAKLAPSDEQIFSSASNRSDRSAAIKISSVDLLSSNTAALVTVNVTWGRSLWELSTGVLFSALANRSFQTSPIIANGQPSLDAGGKINTVVTETVTRPTIVPMVLGHYRLGEITAAGRRVAFLLTGGVGVNAYNSFAEFAAGVSLSVRNFVISPMAHFGRDLRLTNGLALGEQLGSSPPALSTERYWVGKFGIAVSYRLPIN